MEKMLSDQEKKGIQMFRLVFAGYHDLRHRRGHIQGGIVFSQFKHPILENPRRNVIRFLWHSPNVSHSFSNSRF